MTPEELAIRHPQLYHVTEPEAWQNIQQKGLLPTSHILDLYEIYGEERIAIELKRRPAAIRLDHPKHGSLVINDNIPLSEHALAKCLDDGLTPSDWLQRLNDRVFFWPSEQDLKRHLNARLNRNRVREVIIVDTLRLAEAYKTHMELSPINSGATLRKAARRGLQTFTPLMQYSFSEWCKLRGRHRDAIREITVHSPIIDFGDYVLDVYQTDLRKII